MTPQRKSCRRKRSCSKHNRRKACYVREKSIIAQPVRKGVAMQRPNIPATCDGGPECFYWSFVLLSRRLLLEDLSTMAPSVLISAGPGERMRDGHFDRFSCFQTKYRPFEYELINKLEGMSLFVGVTTLEPCCFSNRDHQG